MTARAARRSGRGRATGWPSWRRASRPRRGRRVGVEQPDRGGGAGAHGGGRGGGERHVSATEADGHGQVRSDGTLADLGGGARRAQPPGGDADGRSASLARATASADAGTPARTPPARTLTASEGTGTCQACRKDAARGAREPLREYRELRRETRPRTGAKRRRRAKSSDSRRAARRRGEHGRGTGARSEVNTAGNPHHCAANEATTTPGGTVTRYG